MLVKFEKEESETALLEVLGEIERYFIGNRN